VPAEALGIAGKHEEHASTPSDPAAAVPPAHLRPRKTDGFVRPRSRPKMKTYDASRTSTVMTSSSRSRMIVANAPVAVMRGRSVLDAFRVRPRQKVRANDLAGSRRQHAARGDADRRSRETRFPNVVCPSGSSKYCHRSDRITRFRNIVATEKASHSGRACAMLVNTPHKVDVVEEQSDQCDGQRQNDDGADVRTHRVLECLLLYLPNMLLLSARTAACKMRGSFAGERCCRSPLLFSRLRLAVDRRIDKARFAISTEFADRLLIVASDRILRVRLRALAQAFPTRESPSPKSRHSGSIGTQALVPNHLISIDASAVSGRGARGGRYVRRPLDAGHANRAAADRSAWLAGYLSGSGLERTIRPLARSAASPAGRPQGIGSPAAPIFTPATKAETGHDINISEAEAARIVGQQLFDRVRDLTLRLYAEGAAHAESCGIIVADTKFEFGLLPIDKPAHERVMLIDEVLTPDSSRFWPKDTYKPGGAQPSFDKQFVRDYLEQIRWNKQPPVPSLPDDVIEKTREKYVEAFRRLTGRELAA
jgi:phosphoribosylaminoimidazole-succinocarboxamide synthase